jgi:hypothetical protein
VHRSDRVVAVGLELCNVNGTDAVCLDRIDIDNEAILLQSVSQSVIISEQKWDGCAHVTRVVARN